MSLSVDTWPSVDFRYTVRNTVVLRGLWQPQANSRERFFQTLLSNPCTLGPSGYERPILSGKINKNRHFLRMFDSVCSRLVASFHWLSIGWRPLARFATPAGDSDWFESEPYREIPGWYS
jgi:hypothetical protein